MNTLSIDEVISKLSDCELIELIKRLTDELEVKIMEELLKIMLVGLACPLLLPFVIDSTSEEVMKSNSFDADFKRDNY